MGIIHNDTEDWDVLKRYFSVSFDLFFFVFFVFFVCLTFVGLVFMRCESVRYAGGITHQPGTFGISGTFRKVPAKSMNGEKAFQPLQKVPFLVCFLPKLMLYFTVTCFTHSVCVMLKVL